MAITEPGIYDGFGNLMANVGGGGDGDAFEAIFNDLRAIFIDKVRPIYGVILDRNTYPPGYVGEIQWLWDMRGGFFGTINNYADPSQKLNDTTAFNNYISALIASYNYQKEVGRGIGYTEGFSAGVQATNAFDPSGKEPVPGWLDIKAIAAELEARGNIELVPASGEWYKPVMVTLISDNLATQTFRWGTSAGDSCYGFGVGGGTGNVPGGYAAILTSDRYLNSLPPYPPGNGGTAKTEVHTWDTSRDYPADAYGRKQRWIATYVRSNATALNIESGDAMYYSSFTNRETHLWCHLFNGIKLGNWNISMSSGENSLELITCDSSVTTNSATPQFSFGCSNFRYIDLPEGATTLYNHYSYYSVALVFENVKIPLTVRTLAGASLNGYQGQYLEIPGFITNAAGTSSSYVMFTYGGTSSGANISPRLRHLHFKKNENDLLSVSYRYFLGQGGSVGWVGLNKISCDVGFSPKELGYLGNARFLSIRSLEKFLLNLGARPSNDRGTIRMQTFQLNAISADVKSEMAIKNYDLTTSA